MPVKPISLAGFDDERTKFAVEVPALPPARKPVTVMLPRFDYMPEAEYDAMMAELESQDVEQEVIGVAADLIASGGSRVEWDRLAPEAKSQLQALGVNVSRATKAGRPIDVCETDDVSRLAEFSDRKPATVRKRMRNVALTMLRHWVDASQMPMFEALPSGALDELMKGWRDASALSLGESAASPLS